MLNRFKHWLLDLLFGPGCPFCGSRQRNTVWEWGGETGLQCRHCLGYWTEL